jgi:hypothetical protein
MLTHSFLLSCGVTVGIELHNTSNNINNINNENDPSTTTPPPSKRKNRIYILEPSAGCFSVIEQSSNGSSLIKRHITQFAPTDMIDSMRQLISFRNSYSSNLPLYLNLNILVPDYIYEFNPNTVQLKSIRWPTVSISKNEQVDNNNNNNTIVIAVDEFAQCSIINPFEGEGWMLVPVLGKGNGVHIWVRRVFALNHPPPEFEWPIQQHLLMTKTKSSKQQSSSYVESSLPIPSQTQDEPSWSWADAHPRFLLELSWALAAITNHNNPSSTIIADLYEFISWNPTEFIIVVEWCKDYIIRVIHNNNTTNIQCTSSDGTCQFNLEPDQFFSLRYGENHPDNVVVVVVYAPDCIPLYRTLSTKKQNNSSPLPHLVTIAKHLLQLRKHVTPTNQPLLVINNQPQPQQPPEKEIIDTKLVPNIGQFTAFQDGSMRAVFNDRTIISLSSIDAKECIVLTSLGKYERITTRMPLLYGNHLRSCLEYLTWVQDTPAQRYLKWNRKTQLTSLVNSSLERSRKIKNDIEGILWG